MSDLFYEERLAAQRLAADSFARSMTSRPLAASGLTSYRCRARFSWIMIGAKDHDDAMREALRSCDTAKREDLEVWDGQRYMSAS